MNVSLLSTSADVSLDRETDQLVLSRCRVMFALGLAVTVALLTAGEFHHLLAAEPPAEAGERWVHAAFVGIFAAGFVALKAAKDNVAAQRSIALAVTVALLLNLAVDATHYALDYPPVALVSLIVYGSAALMPWSAAYQVTLVAASVLAVPAARLALSTGLGTPGWWSWPGRADGSGADAPLTTVAVILLGGVSIAVTRTLNHLRGRARRAERLGGYRLLKPLGEGGMGTVYLAEHARMCRPSAVKVLSVAPEHSPAVIVRFQREIEIASRLDHPNTVEIHDFGRADGTTFFFAMEYLVGMDLQRLVQRFGPAPPARVVFLLTQVCDSLAEAHDKGIVHRDLKPPNVFTTRRGGLFDFVKVLDFGLAKELGVRASDITEVGAVMGTPHFMPPEAILDGQAYEPRSDLYSLGCTAYWLLTGRPPFVADTVHRVLELHVSEDPIPVRECSELDIPSDLGATVMQCLEKDPARRFPDARSVRASLAAVSFPRPWSQERAREWWEMHVPDAVPADAFSSRTC